MNNKEVHSADDRKEAGPVWKWRAKREPRASERPSLVEFHERAKAAGAYEKVDERRKALMEAYFTTSASYEDLRPLAGGVSRGRVSQLIEYGMRQVYNAAPELRAAYKYRDRNHLRRLTDFEKLKK